MASNIGKKLRILKSETCGSHAELGKIYTIVDEDEESFKLNIPVAPFIRKKGDHFEFVYDTEAIKKDDKKNRVELVPTALMDGAGRAMTFGADKYSEHNWSNGFEWDRLVGASLRHLNSWRSGEDNDPESGLCHLDHLAACVAMLMAHVEEGLGTDNRRKIKK